jgi:hypothetical protein
MAGAASVIDWFWSPREAPIFLAAAYGATAITLGAVLGGFSSWTAGSRTAEALDDIRGAGWFTAGTPR